MCVLQRKVIAIPAEHPDNHTHRRRPKIDASALRRPDGRTPYLRAFPRQMTFGTRISFPLEIHLCICVAPSLICKLPVVRERQF